MNKIKTLTQRPQPQNPGSMNWSEPEGYPKLVEGASPPRYTRIILEGNKELGVPDKVIDDVISFQQSFFRRTQLVYGDTAKTFGEITDIIPEDVVAVEISLQYKQPHPATASKGTTK